MALGGSFGPKQLWPLFAGDRSFTTVVGKMKIPIIANWANAVRAVDG